MESQETYLQLLFSAIQRFMANFPLHEKMKTVPRFERYFLGSGKKSRDMNELGHAVNTYKIAKELGRIDLNNHLNKNEYSRLLAAALIHDLGEIETGDFSYDEKTPAHEEREIFSFCQKIEDFFPGITEPEKEIILDIYKNIVQDKTQQPKETQYFNLIERIGYLSTALEQFSEQPTDVDWSWLCCNVFHLQGQHLLLHLQQRPSARIYLKKDKKKIEDMMVYFRKQKTELRDVREQDWQNWEKIIEIL